MNYRILPETATTTVSHGRFIICFCESFLGENREA